jgi:SOS-response transcriptional repressor LexA
MSQQQLADEMGVSLGAVGNWESGVNPAKGDNLKRLAEFFQVAPQYLLGETEKKELLLSEAQAAYRTMEGLPMLRGQMAPLISWASAGDAKAFEDQGYDVERIATSCRDPGCYALEIEGDSMEQKYLRGDILFVAPSQEARNGDLVVAKTERGDVYFKLYHWTGRETDPVKLTSFNPVYPSIEMPRSELVFVQPVHSVLRRLRKDV